MSLFLRIKRRCSVVVPFIFLLFFPNAVLGQELAVAQQPAVSVGAAAANTDFKTSTIELKAGVDGLYTLIFRIQNSGHLPAEDARISLILTDRWRYDATQGEYLLVQTRQRPYGESVEWQLPRIAGGGSLDLQSTIRLPEGSEPTPLFASLTSAYAVPVYAEILVDEPAVAPFWSSWLRSAWLYVSYTGNELLYRVTAWLGLS